MPTPRPTVLVAGATGYLGKHVVRALHGAGYPVRALARKAERLGDVRELCAEIVVAEATRPETLEGLVGDAKVMFSSLGKHDFKRKPSAAEIDYQANINLLERAKAGGVEHVVFISVLHGDQLRHRGVGIAEARERVVDAIKASGLAWTILRPSGFFNDMGDFFNMAANGTGWVIGDGSAEMSPIHGADLAAVAAEKIGDPAARGQAFDIGGPDTLTYAKILELAFAALGKPVKTRKVPSWVMKAAPPVVGLFNPMVGDLMRAVDIMSTEGAAAPNHGTHHLADFYAELAAARTANGA